MKIWQFEAIPIAAPRLLMTWTSALSFSCLCKTERLIGVVMTERTSPLFCITIRLPRICGFQVRCVCSLKSYNLDIRSLKLWSFAQHSRVSFRITSYETTSTILHFCKALRWIRSLWIEEWVGKICVVSIQHNFFFISLCLSCYQVFSTSSAYAIIQCTRFCCWLAIA